MDTINTKTRAGFHMIVSLFMVFFLVSSIGTGCSTASKTTRSETETTISHPTDQTSASLYPSETTTVKKESTTETETQSSSHGGVLSTTVDVVGEILAFPFRLIGGLIRAIF